MVSDEVEKGCGYGKDKPTKEESKNYLRSLIFPSYCFFSFFNTVFDFDGLIIKRFRWEVQGQKAENLASGAVALGHAFDL